MKKNRVVYLIGRAKKPIVYALAGFLVLSIAAIIFLRPRALALYYQVKGGMILREVFQIYPNSDQDDLLCDLPPVENETEGARLQKAIDYLETSRKYNPHMAQTYRLLGRAYCLLGEPELAVDAYKYFIHLRPKNPLGCIELGFVDLSEYEKLIRESQINIICDFSYLNQSIIIEEANQAFLSQQYGKAAHWYQLASLVRGIPEPIKFRWSVAEIMLEHDLTHTPDPQVLSVADLEDYVKIKGSTLQWMLDSKLGEPIGNSASGDPSIGYLSFTGEAITAINVHQTSVYHFTIKAQNSLPPPIQLQLEINFLPIKNFELLRGDGSWEELSTDITLDAGLYTLGIKYLNDAVINGIDRNAVIEWIILSKQPPLYPY